MRTEVPDSLSIALRCRQKVTEKTAEEIMRAEEATAARIEEVKPEAATGEQRQKLYVACR